MVKYPAIALLILLTLPSFATTYYVSPSGNDNNSGTSEALAWKTLDKVNAFTFAAGDSIALEGGVIFNGGIINASLANGLPGQPITITNYGTSKATINAGLLEGIYLENASNVTISNLIIAGSGYTTSGIWTCGIDFYIWGSPTADVENVTIDNVEVSGFGGWGIQFYNDLAMYGFKHITVKNSVVHDNGFGGLAVNGSWDASTESVNISNSDIYVGYTKAYNNWGRADYPDNWSGAGIFVGGTDGGLVEYCEAYNNGKENGSTYAGPVGIFTGDAKNVTIQYCISHNNLGGPGKRDGGGFDLDQGVSNCIIQYCESYENEGAGYGLYQSVTKNTWTNNIIRYNTSTNDGRYYGLYGGISLWGQNGSAIVRNANIYGIHINMSKQGFIVAYMSSNIENINFYDNTICIESDAASYLNYAANMPQPANVSTWNNVFPCNKPSTIIPVSYRGAFESSTTPMWTNGWTNYDPQNTSYSDADSVISTSVTSNLTLSGNKKYLLSGNIYVKNGATLTIEPGCVIKAEKANNSSLIITQGSFIKAIGTPSNPIIFTSNQPAGARSAGDWSGLYLLGKAHYNGASGVGHLEGFAESLDTKFGGTDDHDNSGTLECVRIEFAGSGGSGLNVYATGDNTTLSRIQISHSTGDGFNWTGGSTNGTYLVSYKNRMANWKVQNGFNGTIQFGLGVKDPAFASPTSVKSTGFEMLNDTEGSANLPFTAAFFSNVTDIGPLRGNPSASIAGGFGSAVHFSQNARTRIMNSIIMDYPAGVFVDGAASAAAAKGVYQESTPSQSPGNLILKNNFLAGNLPNLTQKNTDWDINTWFFKSSNDTSFSTANLLVDPYKVGANNAFTGDYRPISKSAVLRNHNWNDSAFYKYNPDNSITELISCPATISLPGTITVKDKCAILKPEHTLTYYLSTRSKHGILGYIWSVPDGVSIISGQGTDSVTVALSSTFTSGDLGVKNLSYCGEISDIKTLAIQNVKGLGEDTTVTIICSTEKVNLLPLFDTTTLSNEKWNTSNPSSVGIGTYRLTATTSNACKDTAFAIVKQDIATWKGTTNTNWHDATNWSGGHVPTEKTHVIITGVTPFKCVVSEMDAAAASVQAKASGSISFINGRQLIIYGTCKTLP